MPRTTWSSAKLLERLLRNRSERAYRHNMRELRSRADPALLGIGMALSRSEIQQERITGIDLLAQLGGAGRPYRNQVLGHYLEMLRTETDAWAQASILYGIGHNNETLTVAGTKLLAPFGQSAHADVRRATVQALLGVANGMAIRTLAGLSRDRNPDIRNWATFGLGEQIEADTETIHAALWDRVADRHRDTRSEAIRGLAKRRDPRIRPVILEALRSENFGALLFDAIAAMGDGDCLPLLKRMLRRYRHDDSIDPYWLSKLDHCVRFLSGKPGTEYEAS